MSCPQHINQTDLFNIITRLENYFSHYNVSGIESTKRIGASKSLVPWYAIPDPSQKISHTTLQEVANRLGHSPSQSYFVSPSAVPNYVNQSEKILSVTRDSLYNRLSQLEASCYTCYQGDTGTQTCTQCHVTDYLWCYCDTSRYVATCSCNGITHVGCTCHNRTVSNLCYCRYGGGTSHLASPICYPNHACVSGYSEGDRYSYGTCQWTHVVQCNSPYATTFCSNPDNISFCQPFSKTHCTFHQINYNCRMCFTSNYSYGVSCQTNYAPGSNGTNQYYETDQYHGESCGGQGTISGGNGIGACFSFTPTYQSGCPYNTKSWSCSADRVQFYL